MSAKFTPGPWELIETAHANIISHWHVQIGEIQVPLFPYKRLYSADRTQSAFVKDPEQFANAYLIAAAPELYAALEKFAERGKEGLAEFREMGMLPDFLKAIELQLEEINTALAKARGEA